jgi:hypothetical protein
MRTALFLIMSVAALGTFVHPCDAATNRYFKCKIEHNETEGWHAEAWQNTYKEGSSFRLDFVLFKKVGGDYVLNRVPEDPMIGMGPKTLVIHRVDGTFEANLVVTIDREKNPITWMYLTGVCKMKMEKLAF